MNEQISTFIDLFAGIGGFRLALEFFGLNCVFSSESNKYAQETYFANFGEIPHGDITQFQLKRMNIQFRVVRNRQKSSFESFARKLIRKLLFRLHFH